MAYSTIKKGSTGTDVSTLQTALNNAGYSLDVDGIFGSKTEAAVRDYQSKNGLSVDGIVGTNTWGSINNSGSSSGSGTTGTASNTGTTATSTAQATTSKTPDYSSYSYDPTTNDAYTKAVSALEQASKSTPTFANSYGQQIQDLYDQIVNRDKFSYDLDSDMLYQSMKDQYVNQGQMAMKDTMGQAAALTGGYGSTYAQSVGQQQYDAYLQSLNDNIPEYYQMALDAYNTEGDQLANQYSMLSDLDSTEYSRYADELSNYWNNIDRLTDERDTAYDNGYNDWYNSFQLGQSADEFAYEKQTDAYDNLVDLISATGYAPSADELEAAGMSQSQADAYRQAYLASIATTSSSGGGSSTTPSSDDDSTTLTNAVSLYNSAFDEKYSQALRSTGSAVKAAQQANTYALSQLKGVSSSAYSLFVKKYGTSNTKKI